MILIITDKKIHNIKRNIIITAIMCKIFIVNHLKLIRQYIER